MDARVRQEHGCSIGGQRVGDSKGRRRLRALWPGPGKTFPMSFNKRAWGGTAPLERALFNPLKKLLPTP